MKKLLFVILCLCWFSVALANQNIYYNAATNHIIIDVSAQKTLDQIKQEFGDGTYQMITIDETKGETYKIVDGVLQKE